MKDGVVRSEWSGGQGLRRLGKPATSSSSIPTTTEDELYEAQIRKLSHIIDKAKIQPGHRILEIGSVRIQRSDKF
jgi:cyclopropane-fatty-acyl-phospholipid synthase